MDPKVRLDEVMRNYQSSIVLLSAGKVGLFAALGERTRSASELAAELELDPRAIETVLLALTADGFLEHTHTGFHISDVYVPFLLPDSPETMANILNHNHNCMRRWSVLTDVLKTGQPAPRETEPAEGQDMRDFICGMANISRLSSLEVVEKLDLSPFRRMLDLGGGPATSSIVFAQRYPQLHCVVFDLPGPLTVAKEQIAAAGLADRITTRAGDFFRDDFGTGYDLVYIANIIHSLGTAETAQIVAKSHQALAAGGSLVVKDFFMADSRTEPQAAALFSVNMLVGTEQGKSYTLTETVEILTAAGFGDFQTVPVARASSLLMARRE